MFHSLSNSSGWIQSQVGSTNHPEMRFRPREDYAVQRKKRSCRSGLHLAMSAQQLLHASWIMTPNVANSRTTVHAGVLYAPAMISRVACCGTMSAWHLCTSNVETAPVYVCGKARAHAYHLPNGTGSYAVSAACPSAMPAILVLLL